MPGSFLKKLPPKPESSFRLKNFIFGRLLSGILHKKGWPANLDSKINMKFLTFQSSLRETHEIWCLNLSAPVVNISNGNTAAIKTHRNSFDGAALPEGLWTLKDFPFETFVLQCFSHFSMVRGPSNITLSTAYPMQNGHDALSWDYIYVDYSYEIINLYNPSNHVEKTCLEKTCRRMMTFLYVFGGIFCNKTRGFETKWWHLYVFWRHSMWAAQST